jgi:phage terminase Nu1 subunit (DNA packaging protein)
VTGTELCQALGIRRRQLTAWVEDGLPWTGTPRRRSFDPDEVSVWLVAAGHADPVQDPALPAEQIVLRTRDEVATHFGVSTRSVATWIREGMPGLPGSPGRREGYFPVEEIEDWLRSRKIMPGESAADPRALEDARVKRVRADIMELELAEKRGQLINSEEAARKWVHAVHEAKAQAEQLPAWLMKRLPEDLPREIRRRIRGGLKRRLNELYRTLELGLLAQADELEANDADTEEKTPDRPDAEDGSAGVAPGGASADA